MKFASGIRVKGRNWEKLIKACVVLANANSDRLDAAKPEDREQMKAKMIADCQIMMAVWNDEGVHVKAVKGENLLADLIQNRLAEEILLNALAVRSCEHAELLWRKINNEPLS